MMMFTCWFHYFIWQILMFWIINNWTANYHVTALSAAGNEVKWFENDEIVSIENGFSFIQFNKQSASIEKITSDFNGKYDYSSNILMKPIQLEMLLPDDDENHCIYSAAVASTTTAATAATVSGTTNEVEWLKKSTEIVSFRVKLILSSEEDLHNCSQMGPLLIEYWTVTISSWYRSIQLSFHGEVQEEGEVQYIRHRFSLKSPSFTGLFHRGIIQMKDNNNHCFGTIDSYERLYFLGNNYAMDIINHYDSLLKQNITNTRSSIIYLYDDGSEYQDVLFGQYPHLSLNFTTAWSSLCWKNTIKTKVPMNKKWDYSFELIPNNDNFPVYSLNNLYSFFDESITRKSSIAVDIKEIDEVIMMMKINDDDNNKEEEEEKESLKARLISIYGSPVGCLQSYYQDHDGIIAPTIASPDIGYSPDTNFFDPDNFLALSALLYSGEPYLWEQVRTVLVRTGQTMCGIGNNTDIIFCQSKRFHLKNKKYYQQKQQQQQQQEDKNEIINERYGQLMHHFIDLIPTYESIAGSEQLGPNIFWTLCSLRYVSITQDQSFAIWLLPFIKASVKYVLSFYDEEGLGLIDAPGPLWIDVLIRENYTSDSNAMMIPFLIQVIDYYQYIQSLQLSEDEQQQLQEQQQQLQEQQQLQKELQGLEEERKELFNIMKSIINNMNEYLWSDTDDDHFITQLNKDGSQRDFIDYDANLITVAFFPINFHQWDDLNNITYTNKTHEERWIKRRNKIISRVDSGEYTHVRGTWCSEIPYSGDANDCYIVGGDVCGDSIVTLARIGWIDSLVRQLIRDEETFYNLLLKPLENDILTNIWLYERYNSTGQQIRTPNYFEYPSLITMMQWEVKYGLQIGLTRVVLDPLPYNRSYQFHSGPYIRIIYSLQYILLQLPGTKNINNNYQIKEVIIKGMLLNRLYEVSNSCQSNDEKYQIISYHGILLFNTFFANNCIIQIKLL